MNLATEFYAAESYFYCQFDFWRKNTTQNATTDRQQKQTRHHMRQPGARSREENAWTATAPKQSSRKPQSHADAVVDPLGASKRKLTLIMHVKQAECKTAFVWHILFLMRWLTAISAN